MLLNILWSFCGIFSFSLSIFKNHKCVFTEAVSCLTKSIDIYTDMGRFTIAAKHHQTIAEIYETDIADLDKAINHYEKSADYFRVP